MFNNYKGGLLDKRIQIKDKIYGDFAIDSPVLIELINSKPVQRLRKISQYGVPVEFYHLKKPVFRFNHSIGVMLLLKKLGATEEEQIAGLLHDVSHTAFSHLVDWVIGDGKTEDFQNDQHADFLVKSDISKTLIKYGFTPKRIAEHENFTLLEKDIPGLCADRMDYSLREFPLSIARYCVKNMTVMNNNIVFTNKKSAFTFAVNFLKRQMIHWGGYEAVVRYKLLANILKIALNKKIIKFTDFWENDEYVMNKLNSSKNKEINKILAILKKKTLKDFPLSRNRVYKKFRFVDPEFIQGNKILKLSYIDKNFKDKLEKAKQINSQGVHVPMIL